MAVPLTAVAGGEELSSLVLDFVSVFVAGRGLDWRGRVAVDV